MRFNADNNKTFLLKHFSSSLARFVGATPSKVGLNFSWVNSLFIYKILFHGGRFVVVFKPVIARNNQRIYIAFLQSFRTNIESSLKFLIRLTSRVYTCTKHHTNSDILLGNG